MNKFQLSAIAFCLASTLSGCLDDGSGFTSNVDSVEETQGDTGSASYRNVTEDTGTVAVSPDSVDSPAGEAIGNLIDGNKGSKFLSFSSTVTVIITTPVEQALSSYNITSANDAAERDPASWVLEGSNDGTTWVEIDNQNGQVFADRAQTNEYPLPEGGEKYTQFKFAFANAAGGALFQVAEVELMAIAESPLTMFSATTMTPQIDEMVIFHDESLVNPTSWLWTFEGGTPETSTEKNPLVRYASLGRKTVTLTASNDKGEKTLVKEGYIKVWNDAQPWEGFPKPTVTFVQEIPTDEEVAAAEDPVDAAAKKAELVAGQLALDTIMPDLEAIIHEVSLGVAKQLYDNVTEINIFETLTFTTGSYDFPAAKGGSQKDMVLWFDLKHILSSANQSDAALKEEVKGVLWHELTHGYANAPEGTYSAGNENHAFTEGMANLVRINAGFHESNRGNQKYVETWTEDAYGQTAYFLEWLQNGNLSFNFMKEFNKQSGLLEEWSWDEAFKNIFGENYGVNDAWNAYHKYQEVTLGLLPPFPTPVDGHRNFAVDDNVIASTPAAHIGAWGDGINNVNDNNINKKFVGIIDAPWWYYTYIDSFAEFDPLPVVSTIDVIYTLPTAIVLNKYSITTGNDNPSRDPTSWIVQGSADGEAWTELDVDSYPAGELPRITTYIYDVDNTVAYSFYRVIFSNDQDIPNADDGRLVQLGEVALLTED